MKNRVILISLLIFGLIFFPVINFTLNESRIYYVIDYDVEGSNREEIITKVETLNYSIYLKNYFEGNREYQSYVNADFIQYLKSRIENDTKFHWEMSYSHHLRYFFVAENHSKLYLNYNNNTIFYVKDQNNQSLLSSDSYHWTYNAWYLNFTQLSYVYSNSKTVLLNNVIFLEINLKYGYTCGNVCALDYSITQYLLLSPNLDTLMIFIPYRGIAVA